jgi:acetyl-CoA carboxylase carboxyltransferase component
MGLEGAVRLGLRKELEAIPDEDERERRVRELTDLAHENADALNAATLFEIDDVIDPADTRRVVASTFARAGSTPGPTGRRPSPPARLPFIDCW